VLKGQHRGIYLGTFVTESPEPSIRLHYLVASPMFGLLVWPGTYQFGDSHGGDFRGDSGFLD